MAVPPLNTTIGPDVELPAGAETFAVVHLVPDGSRKIRYVSAMHGNSWAGGNKPYILSIGLPAVTWADTSVVPEPSLRPGQYLPYPPTDGIGIPSTPDPVNQIPYLAEWWPHIGRAAHGFDTIFNSRRLMSMDDAAREVLRKVIQGLIGVARFRVAVFAGMDPLGPLWRTTLPWVETTVQAVCNDCATATAVRHFGSNINVARFSAELANGKIYGADKTVNPWVPGTLIRSLNEDDAQAEESLTSFFSSLEADYEKALDWYDTHIAHLEAPHGHNV